MLSSWMRSDESGENQTYLKAVRREEPGRFKNVWDRCGKQARVMSVDVGGLFLSLSCLTIKKNCRSERWQFYHLINQ